jgi:hypothetical protein
MRRPAGDFDEKDDGGEETERNANAARDALP